MSIRSSSRPIDAWPELGSDTWKQSMATLHMWSQIVGKVRMVQTPWINHSWHVTLYLTARGLTTSPIPFGMRTFQIDFDLIDHRLQITTSGGETRALPLRSQTTAEFYGDVMSTLRELDLPVEIHTRPNEVDPAIRFDEDREHKTYVADDAHRFWQATAQSARVFQRFRAGFLGKCSPVHFFWGSFDLAVTRFSGKPAPEHPGGFPNLPDRVTREAYSHEVSSAGFWPGGEAGPPIFYSYAYPVPAGFAETRVGPAGAGWSKDLGEFVLPYDAVRNADSPDETLFEFLRSTYKAAAESAGWDRSALERTFDSAAG